MNNAGRAGTKFYGDNLFMKRSFLNIKRKWRAAVSCIWTTGNLLWFMDVSKSDIVCCLRKDISSDHIASSKLYTSFGTIFNAVHYKEMACDKMYGIFMKMFFKRREECRHFFSIRSGFLCFIICFVKIHFIQSFFTWKRNKKHINFFIIYNCVKISRGAFRNFVLSIYPRSDYGIWGAGHNNAMISCEWSGGSQAVGIIMISGNHNRHTAAIS